METNNDNVVVNIDGASFKKLVVAAYATADKNGDPLYQYVLLTNNGGYIYAYGTDKYQVYRTIIKCEDGKVEAPSDLRILLCADDIKSIAKSVKSDMKVSIFHEPDNPMATISIHRIRGGESVDKVTYTVPVFLKDYHHFPDDKLEEIFLNSLEYEPCHLKAFNLALFEKLVKAIKTAISSASEKKNLTVEITRSGRNKAEVFTFNDWFDALMMPIKKE